MAQIPYYSVAKTGVQWQALRREIIGIPFKVNN